MLYAANATTTALRQPRFGNAAAGSGLAYRIRQTAALARGVAAFSSQLRLPACEHSANSALTRFMQTPDALVSSIILFLVLNAASLRMWRASDRWIVGGHNKKQRGGSRRHRTHARRSKNSRNAPRRRCIMARHLSDQASRTQHLFAATRLVVFGPSGKRRAGRSQARINLTGSEGGDGGMAW